MTNPVQDGVQKAGQVDVKEVSLITSSGLQIDLRSYMVELNLTEDIFSPALYGNLLITDSANIIGTAPIMGDEYLRVNVVTPGTDMPISKTFRVYAVTDRRLFLDDKSQGYIIHFCSPEAVVDVLGKVFKTFEGTGDKIAAKIFGDYLATARNIEIKDGKPVESEDVTNLVVLNETSNKIKFTSPSWGAMKCLSWVASKSIVKDQKNADCLFYESSKAFYWGSVSRIFQNFKDKKALAGEFYYSPNNVNPAKASLLIDGVQYRAPDVMRAYKIMESFEIVDTFNSLKSLTNGHLANQLLTLDLINKKYQIHDFDYIDKFDEFPHLEKHAPFNKEVIRTTRAHFSVYYKQPGLYSGFKDNFNEKIEDIRPNRLSLLSGLGSFKIEGTVPGRTDYEVGSVVYFGMPKMQPVDSTDKTKVEFDPYYSGLYLITAIRHKIMKNHHVMNVELVKDSVAQPYGQ